jgi:hypothetical protein
VCKSGNSSSLVSSQFIWWRWYFADTKHILYWALRQVQSNLLSSLLLTDKFIGVNWIMNSINNIILWILLMYLPFLFWKVTHSPHSRDKVRTHRRSFILNLFCGILPSNIYLTYLWDEHSSGRFALYDLYCFFK